LVLLEAVKAEGLSPPIEASIHLEPLDLVLSGKLELALLQAEASRKCPKYFDYFHAEKSE
jgi:hypothetical protein